MSSSKKKNKSRKEDDVNMLKNFFIDDASDNDICEWFFF